ncbi:hypothetical protein KI387_003480 [Taxus chinensis]|uniref:UBR-type domain-containing protein n=1 Tax=Taxus chinensis TaxID=29808 RepID=A0AA38LS85_TAXCH|nr:hypothetical protein KI387_003480 [Taxus chinensis]
MAIGEVLELLQQKDGVADLCQRLHEGAVQEGLKHLALVLDEGVHGTAGLGGWTNSQLQGLVSVTQAVVAACYSLRDDDEKSLVVRIFELAVEFCFCYLENYALVWPSPDEQASVLLLLEMTVIDGRAREVASTVRSLQNLQEFLTLTYSEPSSEKLNRIIEYKPQGHIFPREGMSMGKVMAILASEGLLSDGEQSTDLQESSLWKANSNMISVSQHFAVIHLGCIVRLVVLCRKLLLSLQLVEESSDEKVVSRISLITKLLKVLVVLTKSTTFTVSSNHLLVSISEVADLFPCVFKLRFEASSCDLMNVENNLEHLLPLMLETFFQFVSCVVLDDNIFENIRTFIIAALLDVLDGGVWRLDRQDTVQKLPLVYKPQVFIKILRFVRDIRSQNHKNLYWKETNHGDQAGDRERADLISVGLFCHLRSDLFSLIEERSKEKQINIIFSSAALWLDDLISVASFLHLQGVKPWPRGDKSCLSCSKDGVAVNDAESVSGHEDDALFGDLFSEAGKQVVISDGHEQPCPTNESLSHYCNVPLQGATEVLRFLKECIFSPEWHSSLYKEACHQLTKEHVSVLLSMLQSEASSSDERMEGNDPSDMSFQKHLSGHFYKVCFDLLHELVTRHALSNELEDHLVDQVLKVEDGRYVYTDDALVLLAHILIIRTSKRPSLDEDPLRQKICKGYVDFIVEKVKVISSRCLNIQEVCASLPSLFHLEILLMAYHSSSANEKSKMAESTFCALNKISGPPAELNNTQLACWSLLVSRLMLIIRHMILHYTTCPSWLMFHIMNKLKQGIQGGNLHLYKGLGHLESWVYHVVQNVINVNEGITREQGMDDLFRQLIDVNMGCNSGIMEYSVLQNLDLNWDDLYSVISCVLEAWQDKEPSQVEEHILERYCFILGWSVLSDINFKEAGVLPWKAEPEGKLLGTKYFVHFSRILRNNINLGHYGELSQLTSVLLEVISKQQTFNKECSLNERGWVFLRHGAWLSLVISLLQAGLWKKSLRKLAVLKDDNPWIKQTYKDTAFLTLCEQLISQILVDGQASWLLNSLTSLLSMYVGAIQKSALRVLYSKQCESDTPFSISLLLQSGLDKSKEEALLEKVGANFELIKSVHGTVTVLGRLVNQENTGNLSKVFLRLSLHGFPSHVHTGSAALVSSILSVEGILDLIEEFLRTKDALGEVGMEAEVLNSLIKSAMTMKCDRRFEGIHDKCEALLNYLIPKTEERHIYTDLFLMKHMESLVKEMNSREINLAVQENLITNAVDTVERLRMDPSETDVLKFYLGYAEESEILNQSNKLKDFLGGHGSLLALVDALDKCHSELVNVKVLQLFVSLLTDDLSYLNMKQDFQQKFLLMDSSTLAEWLEKRLLGYTVQSPAGILSTHGISNSVRDSVIAFVNALVLPSSHLKSRELRDHFLDAMLIGLEKAFMSFNIITAKGYFNFVVELANGEPAIKRVVKSAINILVKLSAGEIHLEGLKFIIGFLISVLAACGAIKHVWEKLTEKPWSNASCSSGSAICKLKSSVSKKNTDTLVNPINQGAQSSAMECDATSADEDEDDGTSDGELASMDKEDDDDSNSERSLASKVCTFTSSGSNFMEQHWYFCYTCDLTVSKGCCSICARVCHRGHRVVYSRLSRFFCDCGAGGVRGTSCLCLKPRKYVSSSTVSSRGASSVEPFLPLPDDRDHLQPSDSDTDFEDDGFMDNEKAFKLSIPKEEEEGLLSLFTDLNIEGTILSLCRELLCSLNVGSDSVLPNDTRIVLGEDKVLSYNLDLLQLKKAYKSGSFDMKIKAEYSNARELKSHLSSGSIVKSLLTISSRGRLAAGEGDKVTIFDVEQLIGQLTATSVTVDKTNLKPLSKNAVRFELVHLVFNSATENYLAVAGYEECQVLTINPRGEVTDRLAIELALQGAYIRRIAWIPGSQVQLMVVTNKFVKIYDLSQDNISPMHYFTLLEESIVDAELVPVSQGRLVLLVLSQHGILYRHQIEVEGYIEAHVLTDTIQIQDRDVQPKGISLYFSSAYRLIFLSYQDGSTLIGRLNPEAMSIMEKSSVLEDEHDGKLRPAGAHHWKELLHGSGFFVCLSTLKSNAPLAVSVGPTELSAQQLRLSGNSSSPWVGVAAYRHLSKDKSNVLVLHDDGSLQIFSFGDSGTRGLELTSSSIVSPEQVKKIGSGILSSRANAGINPEFPLDFFEKTTCITGDIKLGGDATRNSDSEGAKLNLASDDGFLEGPSSSGFKITVCNSNPDIVMVGCRVHVGNTSASHIPRELGIFQRTVKLEEGMRCWYDMPFTNAEALLADEEFTLTIGPTFNGSSLPRIDSLEVYGRVKDDFGWKEKVDAVLDIDTQTMSGTSGSTAGRKYKSMQTASIQEQVVADGLKLLSGYYSLYRILLVVVSEETGLESGRRNSQPLLEIIFQSDRQQILHLAGRQVLQALYPVKETYYQVKDLMHLAGVVRTCPVLASKIGIGGATTAWVIREFAAQMQAVCKIALHRRANLAAFLESNGILSSQSNPDLK